MIVDVAGEKLGAFASFAMQDVIEVRMTTSCCFPLDETCLLRFERAPHLQVTVTELERRVDRNQASVIDTNPVDLGQLRLTEADLAGLDRLMEFYHTKHDTVCSVVDRIKITRERDGKAVAMEEFTDNACSMLETNYMTFHEIIRRLRKGKS